MSPMAESILKIVTDAGGKLSFAEVKAQVPPEKWRSIPPAFKEARGAGKLDQIVEQINGAIVHSYYIPSGG